MYRLQTTFDPGALTAHQEDLSLHLFPLERELVAQFHQFAAPAYNNNLSRGQWTSQIKQLLLRQGQQEGLLTFPELNAGGVAGEWLFDVVWVDAKPSAAGPGSFDWQHARAQTDL